MTRLQNHRIVSCAVLLLIIGLVLMPLPTIHGDNGSFQEPAARHHAEDRDDEDDSTKKKGKKDPCAKLLRREAKDKEKDKGKKDKKDKDKDEERCIGGSSSGIAKGDFNGDGFGDLAIGVPGEDVEGIQDAGAVNVIYGSGGGLVASSAGIPTNQFWHENRPDVLGGLGIEDQFGSSLAAGDFNGDGFSDLAIGTPGEDILNGATADVGLVTVLYGSGQGLTAAGNQLFRQGSGVDGIGESMEAGDEFGRALSWGDFNGDGFGDLAIGVPSEDLNIGNTFREDSGAVHIVYGSPGIGLSVTAGPGAQIWTQDSPGIEETAETFDRFGFSLAAGDFNGDTRSDLAIGAPLEDLESTSPAIVFAGAVNVLYGSASSGLTDAFNQFWHEDRPGILGTATATDSFGSALAAGDFNGDGRVDLAIGVLEKDVGTITRAGAVQVIYGSPSGLTEAGNQLWTQNSPGIADTAEVDDFFGRALAAGDFNGDGRKDLAIGVPFEDLGSITNAGVVQVIYGSPFGLFARQPVPPPPFPQQPPLTFFSQLLRQGGGSLADSAELADLFGFTLTAWDFGIFIPVADLAIGVPFEDLGSLTNAGAVNVAYGIFGTPDGFGGLLSPGQFWHQDSPGIEDTAELGDSFGRALY